MKLFAIILLLPTLATAQHSVGCASAELNLNIDPEVNEPVFGFARKSATQAERRDRIARLSAAYAIKPKDNLDLKVSAFVGHLSHQGLDLPADEIAAQITGQERGFPVEFPEAWSTKAAVAPVPFAFQRLQDNDLTAAAAKGDLVNHVRYSVLNASAGVSRLLGAPAILELQGMSDVFVRHFLNNLASAPGTQYLEVWFQLETPSLKIVIFLRYDEKTEVFRPRGEMGIPTRKGSISKSAREGIRLRS